MKEEKTKDILEEKEKEAYNASNDKNDKKKQIQARLEVLNRKFLTIAPQRSVIEKTGKPIQINKKMLKCLAEHLGRSADYKTKNYISGLLVKLIETFIESSKYEDEKKEYESIYNMINPGDDIIKLMDTLYRLSPIKLKWDIQYLIDEDAGESYIKASLQNDCKLNCIALYNCYANTLCKEEDDKLEQIASVVQPLFCDDITDGTIENAKLITQVIDEKTLEACRIHNTYCMSMDRYDCFTLFC